MSYNIIFLFAIKLKDVVKIDVKWIQQVTTESSIMPAS